MKTTEPTIQKKLEERGQQKKSIEYRDQTVRESNRGLTGETGAKKYGSTVTESWGEKKGRKKRKCEEKRGRDGRGSTKMGAEKMG